MEKILNEITIYSDSGSINSLLKSASPDSGKISAHYNQNEEFFLKLDKHFIVPSFPIHHDVSVPVPEKEYTRAVREIIEQIIPLTADMFTGITYFFDAAEIFHPGFYQIFKFDNQLYLYLVRLDLTFRPNDGEILERGSNDRTLKYRTRNLYLEADIIPLKNITAGRKGVRKLTIEQNISQTWIGETGRGYFIEGIWIDLELTKFLSKLFVPNNKRIYPYYPFTCKYRTFCHSVIDLSLKGRKKHLIYLHKARSIILPVIEDIQESLKHETFRTDLPEFTELKKRIPPYWNRAWNTLEVTPYLNEHDMKEFSVVF